MIQMSGLSKVYTSHGVPTTVLEDIQLHIERSEFLSIMGRSGSGKSTLLHIMGCMDTFSSGSYTFDGIDVRSMKRGEAAAFRNKKIGFVFQSFNLIAELTALQNVEIPLGYAGVNRNDRKRIAMDMLSKVDLIDRAHHYPGQLSGGQQQRVAIARALANKPDLILADEPTGNLDSHNGEQIMNVLAACNQEGSTLVVITHDPLIAQFANRSMVLRDGRVL